jgi:hypothetical protein
MRSSLMKTWTLAMAGVVVMTGAAFAQMGAPKGGMGTGPVASACKAEIADKCAGKQHGNRAVRTCLEANRSSLSDACKAALDSTGRGRGRNRSN